MNLSTLCITLNKITTAFCTAHKPHVHFSESSTTWLGWWDILGPRAKMLLAVKNRGQKNPQLLHRHQNSKNCTHYYSPRVLLIYKNNMHKKIKTNSCFPKKNQKEKNGNLHCGKKIGDLQIICRTLNGFGFLSVTNYETLVGPSKYITKME